MKLLFALATAALLAPAADRVTLLYDSHGAPGLATGWGYSAYIEYRGKRILFDTGDSRAALAANAKALGVDLAKLDAVVVSHDDPDHYAGLDAVLAVNPRVPVYVPDMDSGAFATGMMNHIYRAIQTALPGQHIVDAPSGALYIRVRDAQDILPGVRLISLPFDSGQRREQSLVLDTEAGGVLIAGCSHPGIVELVRAAGPKVRTAAGGFHLTTTGEADVRKTVEALRQAGIQKVYPAHCTGRFATDELRRTFGAGFGMAAAGGAIPLDTLNAPPTSAPQPKRPPLGR